MSDEGAGVHPAILEGFEREADPYYSSARLWDDGVIDPAETRDVLSLGLQAPSTPPSPAPPSASSACDHSGDYSGAHPSPEDALAVSRLPGGVLHLRLNRPRRRNALDGPLAEALLGALRAVPAGGDVRAVLLSGAGPAFCAGADLRWMHDGGRAPGKRTWPGLPSWQTSSRALDACPVPTVARVHGATYGGGLGLVVARWTWPSAPRTVASPSARSSWDSSRR